MLSEIDDHGFDDTSSTRKVSILNDTYWDVCSREDWPFLEATSSSINTVGGSSALTMPARFLRTISLSNPGSSYTLLYEDYENIAKVFPALETTQAAAPLYYYFLNNTIHLYPVPTGVVALRLRYTTWPTELAVSDLEAAIVIPPRHHRVLLNGALSKLYAMEDDPENSALQKAEFEARIDNMAEDLLRRKYHGTKERNIRANRRQPSRSK